MHFDTTLTRSAQSVRPSAGRQRRIGIRTSASVLALCIAAPAVADCPSIVIGQSVTCNNSDSYSSYTLEETGVWAQTTYTFNNSGNMTPNSDLSFENYGLLLEITGGNGSTDGSNTSEAGGIAGGILTLDNSGTITMTGTTSQSASQSELDGIKVYSGGGNGVEPDDNGEDGGRGGDGGTITLTNSGAITLETSAAVDLSVPVNGINVQSQSGNGGAQNSGAGDQKGGNAGDAKAVTVTNSAAITLGAENDGIRASTSGRGMRVVSTGGNGGTDNGEGGAGGDITITNTGAIAGYFDNISTGEYGYHGIFAATRGGNGLASFDNSDNGGRGEEGRTITLTNSADITLQVYGNNATGESAGIYAQSAGGDGGASADKSTGGSGGGASTDTNDDPAVMTVNMSGGTIDVGGYGVRGIVTRSEGGNGGNGNGNSDSTGGQGGYGGQIQVNFTGDAAIVTSGYEGYGILGQSVGGIGGDNAGAAGKGGNAGGVGAFSTAGTSITTTGDYGVGMTFHSVGGGGGTGEDFTGVLAGSGGNGGNGGNAGKVTFTSASTISTSGEHAYGLLAQSIGGAGGTGGISDGLTLELGGSGGGGGAGNVVEINNTGAITTTGDYAIGIVGQSLSGGGGAAGTAGGILSVGGSAGSGANNTVTSYVTNSGDITTSGNAGLGIVMQSIGGGGGTGGGANGILTVGGSGSSGGNGGNAQVFAVGGTIETGGDHAYGIVTQSIGGGGGNGGDVIDVSAGVGIGIGGRASGGGNAGGACTTNYYGGCASVPSDSGSEAPQMDSSTILTSGDFSHGVVTQSIGGGGGNGGDFQGASLASVVSVQVGGAAGGAGAGGGVTADFENLSLSTSGDNAKGIIAHSVGGGGGNGGNSTAVNGITPLAFQVGGAGGGGGGGGASTISLTDSTIITRGNTASAVVGQSVGGGGGTGGSAYGFDASIGFTFDSAIGGNGGDGGAGNTVTATLDGTCVATGFSDSGCTGSSGTALGSDAGSSHGLTLHSVGGGGGTGGTSLASALTIAAPTGEGESVAVTGTFAVGGDGGSGGDGNTVTGTLSGDTAILTGGEGAHGILAQSVGGGGGDGGSASALSGSVGVPNTTSVDLAMSLGGSGGSGGSSNTVTLHLNDTASITTYGENANGIVAQSIGGGGGDGGVGNAHNDKIGRGLNVSLHAGLGGVGGSGGTGGTVDLTTDSGTSVTTYGSGSHGLVMQSIGGGGGTGQGGSIGLSASGFTVKEMLAIKMEEGSPPQNVLKFNASGSVELNVGGKTGSGNTAGTLNSTTRGRIATNGDDADAIVLQSIGGGGGVGGTAGSNSGDSSQGALPRAEIAVDSSIGVTMSVGGKGGTGGHGGAVNYTLEGAASTQGDFADGLILQSIGGGGGNGGAATNGDGAQQVSINMALGGTGGAGGNGGNIDLAFNDDSGDTGVTTQGHNAHAVLIQSIGAGGGHGATGTAAGAGGEDIDSGGGSIHSLDVDAGISLGAGYGGNGGASGNGGNITVDPGSYAGLTTHGNDSYAMLAQSIGGGGGTGGVGAAVTGDGPLDVDLEIVIGGTGGSSGDGGTVDINTGGVIGTHGDRAFGIVAQSIGGGGGLGGTASDESVTSVSFQSQDGAQGFGGPVSVELSSGSITTEGAGAHGIIAQSIGGGGGIGGDLSAPNLDVTYPGVNGSNAAGNGGTVEVTLNGGIFTNGPAAYGVIAQSIGGQGGLYGNNGTLFAGTSGGVDSNSETVTVTANHNITTSGEGSIGIFAQSTAADSFDTVDITVGGTVTGGTGTGGNGVFVSEGQDNILTINSGGGVIAGDSDAYAVQYQGSYDTSEGASLTIDNSGTLTGNVLLVSADQTLTTPAPQASAAAMGAFALPFGQQVAGRVINRANGSWTLGDRNVAHVLNGGLISTVRGAPGRSAHIAGQFRQTANGILEVAADFGGGAADRITFGDDVTLDGKLRIASTGIAPGTTHSVLSFGGAVSGALEAEDTAAVDYQLDMVGSEAVVSINGTQFGSAYDTLNSNQSAVGAHLDRIYDSGAQGYAGVLAGLDALSAGEDGAAAYAAGLSSLTPGSALAAAATQAMFAQTRLSSALGCRTGNFGLTDPEATCSWADIGGLTFDQEGDGGYDGNQFVVSGGLRTMLDSEWKLGVALGYESSSYSADDGNSSADGDGGYVALALGRGWNGFELGAAVTASYGVYDLERGIVGASAPTTAKGDTDIASFGARLHGSRLYGDASGYIRPALDLDLVHTRASGYTETGAGAYDLAVQSQSETILIATPSVEIGRAMTVGNGMGLTMFAKAGLSLSNADEWSSVARLDMADASAGSFTSSVPVADQLGRVSVGLSLATTETFEARLEYSGAFGDDFASHGLGLGITTRW
ncbi:autotransporter outer membrane beta-barrel domain-containing protein [Marinibacterium profundimaris]|uniref:autotransporter outer membrane beta-barrel domain-containing protein n=1 Tax=Marinibacterium profundimaris TaxID=1679460 RepID=UPI00117DC74B|nr:autotransporter outer membrane beta-barrel domain-containing protein [Marinibacterium profundimaris]